jgi:hypothetical protein
MPPVLPAPCIEFYAQAANATEQVTSVQDLAEADSQEDEGTAKIGLTYSTLQDINRPPAAFRNARCVHNLGSKHRDHSLNRSPRAGMGSNELDARRLLARSSTSTRRGAASAAFRLSAALGRHTSTVDRKPRGFPTSSLALPPNTGDYPVFERSGQLIASFKFMVSCTPLNACHPQPPRACYESPYP